MRRFLIGLLVGVMLSISVPANASEPEEMCGVFVELGIAAIPVLKQKQLHADKVKEVLYEKYGGASKMSPYIRAMFEVGVKVVNVMVDDAYAGGLYGTSGDTLKYTLRCFDEMDKHADKFERLMRK